MADIKAYSGSCHCGAVTFGVEADLSRVIACNCSICEMKGLTLAFTPETKLRLASGEGELTEYRFNSKQIGHQFCRICGVETFGRATAPRRDAHGGDQCALAEGRGFVRAGA